MFFIALVTALLRVRWLHRSRAADRLIRWPESFPDSSRRSRSRRPKPPRHDGGPSPELRCKPVHGRFRIPSGRRLARLRLRLQRLGECLSSAYGMKLTHTSCAPRAATHDRGPGPNERGALVFFKTTSQPFSHVGIITLETTRFIHATRTGGVCAPTAWIRLLARTLRRRATGLSDCGRQGAEAGAGPGNGGLPRQCRDLRRSFGNVHGGALNPAPPRMRTGKRCGNDVTAGWRQCPPRKFGRHQDLANDARLQQAPRRWTGFSSPWAGPERVHGDDDVRPQARAMRTGTGATRPRRSILTRNQHAGNRPRHDGGGAHRMPVLPVAEHQRLAALQGWWRRGELARSFSMGAVATTLLT